MKNRTYKLIALIMSATMILPYSGCRLISEPVPELIEPAAQIELFRAVAKRPVSTMYVADGDIVPTEYCHCFKRAVSIESIKCEVGQYVEAGSVIATADLKSLNDELTEKKAYLEYIIAEHELTLEENRYNLATMQCSKSAMEAVGASTEAGNIQKQIDEFNERSAMEEELYGYLLSDTKSEIAEINETLADGTLKAKASGYVTYVKNTDAGINVTPDENVVVIADFDKTYIEAPSINDMSYRKGAYDLSKFQVKYALYKGVKHDIEEISFTDKESALMKSRGSYAQTRFDMTDGTKGEVGDKVLLYFYKSSKQDVLSIGVDSENQDDSGSYVYVQKDGDNLEKRYVELGDRDDCYIEVISGLSEGEMVLCSQDSMPPADYDEFEVKETDYKVSTSARTYQPAHLSGYSYFAEKAGKVEELCFREDDTFKAGDTLMIIDTGAGNSEIVAVQNEITSLAIDHTTRCQSINDSLGEADAEIGNNQNIINRCNDKVKSLQASGGSAEEIARAKNEASAAEKQKNVQLNMKAMLEKSRDLEELSYNYNLAALNRKLKKAKELNQGGGKYYVKAKADGVVAKVNVTKGEVLSFEKGTPLLVSTYQTSENKYNLVMSDETKSIHIGDEIECRIKDSDEKHFAKSLTRAYGGRSFAFTEGENTYLTSFPKDKKINKEFVIEATEPNFRSDSGGYRDFNEIFINNYYDNVLLIPNTLVYSEKSKDQKKTYYYVWKVTDNGLEKQFIQRGIDFEIGESSNTLVLTGLSAGDRIAKKNN